ncbi:MAG: HEPN domain-containing protein [Vulcanimicrobiaceae bacterium]
MQRHPRELAGNWLAQAERDLASARHLFAGGRFEAVCFACQQSAEKALKAALIWLAGDRPRTHELGALVAELATVHPEAREHLGDLAALDPYYLTTRYPDAVGGGVPGTQFFEPDARLALERATRAVAYAANLLPPL